MSVLLDLTSTFPEIHTIVILPVILIQSISYDHILFLNTIKYKQYKCHINVRPIFGKMHHPMLTKTSNYVNRQNYLDAD